jgi:hypothetical protein
VHPKPLQNTQDCFEQRCWLCQRMGQKIRKIDVFSRTKERVSGFCDSCHSASWYQLSCPLVWHTQRRSSVLNLKVKHESFWWLGQRPHKSPHIYVWVSMWISSSFVIDISYPDGPAAAISYARMRWSVRIGCVVRPVSLITMICLRICKWSLVTLAIRTVPRLCGTGPSDPTVHFNSYANVCSGI